MHFFSGRLLKVIVACNLTGVFNVGTESFGLFSCTINGEERDQTHRAVYR